ncbi:MAG: hypothetical protein V3T20_01860 [Gemmatimonadota bacterium]
MIRAFPIVVAVTVIGVSVHQASHDVPEARSITAYTLAVQSPDFAWSGRVAQGQSIEIKGINGPISASRASGGQVEVAATKRAGDRGDPDEVTFEVVEHGGGVTICAMYPSRDRDKPNECAPGSRGRMNVKDNDTKVTFTVRVPDGVNLVAKTVNGKIEADGIGGDVRAATVNGDVEVAGAGVVEAQTVNGSIDASMGQGDWSGDLEFSTVNGTITVALPAGVGADVRASTVNGSLETDFPLTVQGRWGPKSLRGTIGNGGRGLHMSTVNGSIRLRRR